MKMTRHAEVDKHSNEGVADGRMSKLLFK